VSEYENNSAIVVEYKSKYYKVLDKTTKGQLQAAWDLNNSSKDDDMIEVSYPSGMSVHAVLKLFAVKLKEKKVPVQWLDQDWHYFFDSQMFIPVTAKLIHAINKKFDLIWRKLDA
jgi:hypothetical protein